MDQHIPGGGGSPGGAGAGGAVPWAPVIRPVAAHAPSTIARLRGTCSQAQPPDTSTVVANPTTTRFIVLPFATVGPVARRLRRTPVRILAAQLYLDKTPVFVNDQP